MKKLLSTSLCIVFILLNVCINQTHANDSFLQKEDHYIRFRNISIKDGLSSNEVWDILQDKFGIMWFATVDGLTRYDGSKFTIYKNKPEDNSSLSCSHITALAEDVYGNIWVGTQDGLNRYIRKTDQFERFRATTDRQTGLRNNDIRALHADLNGFLWVETSGDFISRLDINSNIWDHTACESVKVEGLSYHHIFEDSSHNLWICGKHKRPIKIAKMNEPQIEYESLELDKMHFEVTFFAETPDRDLYCYNLTSGYILRYDSVNHNFEQMQSLGITPSNAVCDDSGRLWIGCRTKGIRLFDPQNRSLTMIEHQPDNLSLISNNVLCVYKDRNGNIWFGTTDGISLYSERLNYFRHYRQIAKTKNGLSSNDITALMQDRDGLLWVGTEENGVDTFSLSTEYFGNVSYSLINHQLERNSFEKEKQVLKQYYRHGLIRSAKYDENIFDNYSRFTKTPLTFSRVNENVVSALYQDKTGRIYIGLWAHVGFNVYDKNTRLLKRYALWSRPPDYNYAIMFEGNPFGANWYAGFLEDSKSRFWCATWEAFGLNLFDRDKGAFASWHYIPGDRPRNFNYNLTTDTVKNRMYIAGYKYYGYYDFIKQTFNRYAEVFPQDYLNREIVEGYYRYCKAQQIALPLDFYCWDILPDKNDVWIITSNSVLRHTLTTNQVTTLIQTPYNQHVKLCKSLDSGYLWMGVENEINRVVLEDNKVETIVAASDSMWNDGNFVTSLYEDSRKRLWIGANEGIYILNQGSNPQALMKNMDFGEITAITAGQQGKMIIACSKGLIILNEGKGVTRYSFSYPESNGLPGTEINSVYADKQDNIWICTNDGLALINNTGKMKVFRNDPEDRFSILSNQTYSVSEDKYSNLWISTSEGLCVYNRETGEFADWSAPADDCLSSRLASCIMEDRSGNIWFGTTEKGINVLNPQTDKITHYMYHTWDKKGISDNYIKCMYEDRNGNIWIGTGKGLDRFHTADSSFKHIAFSIGSMVMGIQEDLSGNIWVSANNGLFCLDQSGNMLRRFHDYHGLQDNGFSEACCKLHDGRLAFGGSYGFNVFDPGLLMADVKPAKIVFSNFAVDHRILHADVNDIPRINLEARQNSFSVGFSATDYEFGDHIRYRYRLEGFDRDWIYVTPDELTAGYTNLDPGSYVFTVEATNEYLEWNGAPGKLIIQIATPWYRQWWFTGLVLLILIAGIYLVIRLREEKLKKENLRLERIIGERTHDLKDANNTLRKFFGIISHDLRNPIKALNITSGQLYHKYEKLDEKKIQDIIRVIYEDSQKTGTLLENLLSWAVTQIGLQKADLQKIDLYTVTNACFEYLQLTAANKNIRLVNLIPEQAYVLADENMLSTVLRNLVNNAIVFSPPGEEVIVKSKDNNGNIEISVVDHGIGMDEETMRKLFRINEKLRMRGTANEQGTGFGLIITREFVDMQGGAIHVESVPGKGSVFTFTLKKYEND